jgi:hypothetical protein
VFHNSGDISWHKNRVFISAVFRFEELGVELITPVLYRVFVETWRSENSIPKSFASELPEEWSEPVDECIVLMATVENYFAIMLLLRNDGRLPQRVLSRWLSGSSISQSIPAKAPVSLRLPEEVLQRSG